MNMDLKIIVFFIAAFLLGSLPFGLILARLSAGVDLRATGSGNIGATNVARTLGLTLGLITLLLDMAKGLAPVLIARFIFGNAETAAELVPGGAGLAAFLGHAFSPFLGFKGGKGVSTALGVLLGLTPLAVIPALVVFVAVVARWDYVSAGSLSAALAAPLSAYFIGYPSSSWALSLVLTALIFVRHHENIGRLIRGEETKWRKKTA